MNACYECEIENKLKEKQLWGIAAKSKKGQEVLIEPVSKNKFEVSVLS